MHSSPADCHRTRLASGPAATVEICDCGAVQLHVGPVTLRVTPEALLELADTLERAAVNHRTMSVARRRSVHA